MESNIFTDLMKMVAVNFSEWKDKEYPCKWFEKYGKHNSTEWFTIDELYEMFLVSEKERLKKEKEKENNESQVGQG